MTNKIPNSVIGAVSSVLAEYHYSHSTLNSLFMESGAPGGVPEGNCETKCYSWLRRCNDDSTVDPMQVLGQVIQKFMDLDVCCSPYRLNFEAHSCPPVPGKFTCVLCGPYCDFSH